MIVLGIDTSCDDTGIGIVKNGKIVLSSSVSSQIKIHRKYGGVIPELASREHLKNFTYVLDEALREAGLSINDIDLVSVTEKPGLPGALLTGLTYAKTISYVQKIPIVFVNHIQAHVSAAYLSFRGLKPPFFSLVVSGGHTSMIDVTSYTGFRQVGTTRDDAAGEAFDKVGNMLGLEYPGGVSIDRLIQSFIKSPSNPPFSKGEDKRNCNRNIYIATPEGRKNAPIAIGVALQAMRLRGQKISFTRPYLKDTPDFSFSGIKTQVLYFIREKKRLTAGLKKEIAFAFSDSVTDVLCDKTFEYAMKLGRDKIVLAGGVASNTMLREKFLARGKKEKIGVFIPEKKFCTDNGAMVAALGYYTKGSIKQIAFKCSKGL